jgi:hypothetical protein
MRRHAKRDDLVLLAISLKVDGVMAFVPIEDEKAVATIRSLACRPVEVL